MDINQINSDILCILRAKTDTGELWIDSIPIVKDALYQSQLERFLTLFDNENFSISDLLKELRESQNFTKIPSPSDYCVELDRPWQSNPVSLENFTKQYDVLKAFYFKDSDCDRLTERLGELKTELREYVNSKYEAYFIRKTYENCRKEDGILAFSHRRVGFKKFEHNLTEDFSIQFKTNFGYGSVSYFYTQIIYKNLQIVPFSDLINYQFAKLDELVQYSSKHPLRNQSWFEAMEFISQACNISLQSEEEFIMRYVIDQCKDLANGLTRIVNYSNEAGKGHKFFNPDGEFVELRLSGYSLINFQGEKTSDGIKLLKYIRRFEAVASIQSFVKSIEDCAKAIMPKLKKEQHRLLQAIVALEEPIEALDEKRVDLLEKWIDASKCVGQEKTQNPFGNGFAKFALWEKGFRGNKEDWQEFQGSFNSIFFDWWQLKSQVQTHNGRIKKLGTYLATFDAYFEHDTIVDITIVDASNEPGERLNPIDSILGMQDENSSQPSEYIIKTIIDFYFDLPVGDLNFLFSQTRLRADQIEFVARKVSCNISFFETRIPQGLTVSNLMKYGIDACFTSESDWKGSQSRLKIIKELQQVIQIGESGTSDV